LIGQGRPGPCGEERKGGQAKPPGGAPQLSVPWIALLSHDTSSDQLRLRSDDYNEMAT
jgi:hypothetical protein